MATQKKSEASVAPNEAGQAAAATEAPLDPMPMLDHPGGAILVFEVAAQRYALPVDQVIRIVEMVEAGDLVITADIPLADRVIAKGAHAIDHRGELYSVDNIKQYLAMRNLMEEIRDSGVMTKGPAAFSQKDAHEFANQLHRFLTKYLK